MDKSARIYVAGHRGLGGTALMRRLHVGVYTNIITRTHSERDLTDQRAVREFFAKEHPEYVFLAAAKVGGIHANNTYPADFIYQNLAIETNVMHESWCTGVKRLLPSLINIGYGKDITIRELAEIIRGIVGFKGEIMMDFSKHDGTPQKLLDVGRLNTLGWRAVTEIKQGITMVYDNFLAQ